MKRYIVNVLIICAPFMILYAVFSQTVLVTMEMGTGPELLVIAGRDRLESEGSKWGVNYTQRAYTTYPLTSNNGIAHIGTSFAFYRVSGSEATESSPGEKAAVLEINTFYPAFLVIPLAALCLGIYFFAIVKSRFVQ